MIACSVVDLPAPFGPISPTISPLSSLQRQVAHGGDGAVAHLEVLELEGRLSHRASVTAVSPRYAAATSRFAADLLRRARGERPALVEHVDPVADAHHERHVVVDQEHAGAEARRGACGRPAANSGTSALGQARGRLVHQHERGLDREHPRDAEPPLVAVRERVRRRVAPAPRARAARAARPPRRRASRGPAPTPSAATSTFSRTERLAERAAVLERPREPGPARRCELQRVMSLPPSSTVPVVGTSKPLSTLTSVDFPAPFGPISPTTSCRRSSSDTSLSALHALEGARDGGGPKGLGPPLRSSASAVSGTRAQR